MIMEPSIWSILFWQALLERALKTAAQAGLAYLPLVGFSVIGFDWRSFAGIVAGGAVASVLTSLVGNAVTKTGPSWGTKEEVPHQPTDPLAPRRADLPPDA